MGQTTKPTVPEAVPRDAIEEQVDEAIEICGGDARKAVRGLILGQALIKSEIEKAVSAGYVRRRLH
jgi:hypothetical protein